MLLLLRFGLCLPFQRRVPAKAVTPLYAGLGGRGAGTQPCTLSPPFLGQNGLDAYSVAAICARRHSVIYTCCSIKKQIILKFQSFHSASHWTAGAEGA